MRRRVLPLLLLVLVLGCSRYEVRSPDCPPEPRAPSRSAIAWVRAGKPGSISGRVVTENLHALAGATVTAKPGGAGAYADSAGWFAIDTLQPGHYQLLIRGIGYGPATDSVELLPGMGIEIHSVMMPQEFMLDRCGHIQVRVRKPWWKWW